MNDDQASRRSSTVLVGQSQAREDLAKGNKVGPGLGTQAAVVAGNFLSCWPVGMGEPSSRCYPPLWRRFELALERGHSVKGFQHPERSIFYVNRRQRGNCTSFD